MKNQPTSPFAVASARTLTSRAFVAQRLLSLMPSSKLTPSLAMAFLFLMGGVTSSWGQISITTFGAALTEDFNTLASTGTSSTVPTGWAFSEVGSNMNTTYTAGTGSSATGDTYSFGATSDTDRAFGGLLSGSVTPTIGVAYTNNTGGTITSLAIAYTGEQWRLGATSRVDRLDFQYSTNATSLTTGAWTDVDALDFTAPVTTGTVGMLDGNSAPNRTAISSTITGLSIANGATFWIRWNDFNATGSDDGLSVEDFSLSACPTVTCPANSFTCLSGPVFALTGGSPAGGVYSGVGVSGGNFDPAVAGVGIHTITYTYTSGSCSGNCMFTITVDPSTTFYRDIDGDGLGDPANTIMACSAPPGYVADNTDFCPLTVSSVSNEGNCGCTPGMYPIITVMEGNNVITGCQICPAGSYCPDGLVAPIPCPAGKYSDVAGAVICSSCPVGTYNDMLGQTECTECAEGTYNGLVGAIACTPCPAGKYSDVTGAEVCLDCEAGKYSAVIGSIACTPCPAGKYNALVGQVECTNCPAGKYSALEGQIACTDCPAGKYNALEGQIACADCPAGKYNALLGQIACTDCPAGKYNALLGQIACTDCPVGKFSATVGQIACTNCPVGTYNDQVGQIICPDCPEGTYNELEGQTFCLNCPDVTCPSNSSVLLTDTPFALTGAMPAGGTYTGAGVSAGIFSPGVAGLGSHTITYNYADMNGCTGSCMYSISVNPAVLNTQSGENFATIQAAIDDAQTLNGHTIAIPTGSYTGGLDASLKDLAFAPGNSPGCVNIVGDMTLTGVDDLIMEINGTTACTQYDQFDVDGMVTLGGADLILSLGYVPADGDQYTLIDNDLADPVSGQFAQGTSFSSGIYNFTINYAGGSGNDVVMTACLKVLNTNTSLTYCTLQAAIDAASPMDGLELLTNITEGQVTINKALTIDGNGFTLTSNSPNYGVEVNNPNVTITDLTIFDAATFGLQVDCNSDNLVLTNVTVNSSGGTGIGLNGSDNAVITNLTSTNNVGNGMSVTDCNNTSINGYTSSGNAFMSGFNAGIGLFTSGVYCPPAGINGFSLTGTISITESTKVYSQKVNASHVITGLSGTPLLWAVGIGALDRNYWPDKPTAYAVVDALFEAPYSYSNTLIYVAEVATENFYVDDDPNGDASPPMLIQTAVTYEVPGKTIFLESGTFSERVTLDKSLTLDGNGAGTSVLDGTGLAGTGSGITLSNGITNITIRDLTVRDYAGADPNSSAGIKGVSNNNLLIEDVVVNDNVGGSGIYLAGPINLVTINNADVFGHTNINGVARGIVIWDNHKSNITITNCEVYNNNCCGIELQDGSSSAINISNNNVHDNWDNGIGLIGMDGTTGSNTVNGNTVTNNGRFGIEIKNPNGNGSNITVNGNTVTQTASFVSQRPSEVRDIAGIAVFRRGVTGSNVDVPTGVDVTNNTVSGYIQDNGASTSEGFGIVIEGTYHTVTGNIVSSNDVGLQQQAGHTPYPGDGDQNNLADTYFGRGNSPMTCGNIVTPNTLTNPINTRNVGVVGGQVTNTTSLESFCTIQDAIDDAQTLDGHTLAIAAGTYNERVTLTKQLTLDGVGAGSTILDGTGLAGNGNGITINTGITNVTIKDLTVRDYAGASGNANAGIYGIGGNNNLSVTDVDLADNLGGSGFYANGPIDNVLLNNVDAHGHTVGARGIVIWNGHKSNITITNCEVYNNNCCGIELQDGSASGVTMTNNNVHDNGDNGIGLIGLDNTTANNLVDANTVTNNGRFGIEIKNPNGNGTNTVISNNNVTQSASFFSLRPSEVRDIAGIAVMRRGVTGSNVDVPNGVRVINNTVSGYIQDNGASVSEGFGIVIEGTNHTATGNIVSSNDVGLQQQAGHTPYPGDGDQNNLADSYFGRGNSPMTCGNNVAPNTYAGNGANTRNISVGGGLVTNTTTMETFCSIQSAIDDANTLAGHTISVSAGTYTENVIVTKGVIINGAGLGVTIIQPAISDPNCGGAGGGSLCAGSSNVFLIQSNNVTISNLTVDGNNPALTGGYLSNGIDVDARNGIITNHVMGVYNNLVVNNVEVKNIYLRGMYASSGGTFTFSNNTVTNVAGEAASIAMFNFGGAGSFANNTVSLANDGIASNHSKGTTYTGNTVTLSGSGIHTDNNGSGGGVADLISGNSISNGGLNSYGIFTFAPYLNVVVQDNTLTNLDVGLASAGSYTPGVVTTFTRNVVDAQSRPASTGMYATTNIWGFTPGNNTVLFTNNVVKNTTDDAFYLSTDATYTLDFTASNNSITANPSGVEVAGAGTLVENFQCNWWGFTDAPTVATLAATSANFTPWLISGVDGDGMTPGFQPSIACASCMLVLSTSSTPANCSPIDDGTASVSVTSGGISPYAYLWSNGGTTSTITGLAIGTYTVTVTDFNGCTSTASAIVGFSGSGPVHIGLVNYCTIQDAIDAASPGNTITVDAGTYAEDIIVDKSLTILGPNSAINPCTGVRVGEAIVVPATGAISFGEIFHVAASNVTISGFTIDGDNPSISSGFTSTNGADIDAAEGITVYETGVNNLTATNNIIQNLSYFGVTLYDYPAGVPSSGHSIANNKIQDLGTYDGASGIDYWGGGVLLYNNQYAAVTDNCMENVRLGVQTGNFSQANPGSSAYQVISGNTMSVRKRGIFHNLAYSTASGYTLSNNTITGVVDANETAWDGILLSSLSVPSTSTNNIINGAGIANPSEGYEVWNVKSTAPASISGGSVSATTIGLSLNNYEGYNSNGADGAHATVTNLAITPVASGTGIRLHDNPLSTNANVQLTIGAGVTVSGGTTGLRVENASASIVGGALNNLSLAGTTGQYIDLVNNAGDLDATAVSFDGPTGFTATLPQLFAIENKINHEIDNNALGFVTVKANNAYVTDINAGQSATNNDYTRLRNAVELAANTWSINLNGSFDWTETNAAASWALGNDDTNATGDDYGILVPANLNGITFTAPLGLTTASIQGPGDVPTVNLEGVLYCDGAGDNQNWTISNIEFLDFDMPVSMFNGAGGVDAYNGTTITNNRFDIATDLNSVAAPSDPNQNIGIHYSFGANQTISNNIFNIPGDGVSNGVNYSTTVVMQSNTSGGSVYDGLLITGNTINILNAQDALNPQVVLGIWENGHAHTSNITVSNNQFINLAGGNNPLLNLHRAFRVTSHSGAGSTVTYSGNTVSGANIGFQWISGSNFSAQMPVAMTSNILNGNDIGMLLQSNGKALLTSNNFNGATDNNRDVQIQSGSVVTTGGSNQWAGEGYYVENLSANALNITGETFDQADQYRRTDRMYGALDNPASGLIRFDGNNLYVSAPATGLSDETIPNAISAAAASGDFVHIETGSYTTGLDATSKEITIVPGASPGCVTLGGDLVLTGGDVLAMEINGTTPCTTHDQLIVNGTVTLGGANLSATLGYGAMNGDQIVIIDNDGGDAVIGQFAQGGSVILGGNYFLINYAGGSGNDVVLTMCAGVQNTTTLEVFCTIQEGVDDAQTLDGHTLSIAAGTYNERVTLTKQLTLDGAGAGSTILDGTGLAGNGNGITINTGIINVTIKDLTVRDYAGANPNANAGIYGIGGNNNLTVTDVDLADNIGGSGFYANGPIDNVLMNNVDAHGHTNINGAARGIVIWNGHKSNITITNCEVYNNNCCGIELQDGSGSGINVSNNNVHDNWDNGIGLVGLDNTTANNLVDANTVTNNGRFGIEIKNPNGNGTNTVISNNNVTQSASFVSLRPSEVRDIAGIAVFRRGLTGSNVDVPNGVQVINNTVSGYIQDNGASASEGFGIVIEGTNHTATGNTINNNDIGLQQQAGHTPYPGDGNQNDMADTYFGRGNSPITCGNTVAPNTYAGNGTNTRNISVGGGLVTNTTTMETFCSIQSAIDDAGTVNGHTLSIADGTYNENVNINKELTLTGGGNGSNPATNTVLTPSSSCSGVGLTISAANVTIQNMYVTNYQDAVLLNGVANPTISNMALVDYCRYGVNFGGNNSSVQILLTNIQRTSFLANTIGIRVGTANAVNGLLINNSSITGNALQGIVVFQATVPVAFDNITITNSTISDNLQKGLYFEKLNNALLSNLTMNNNGTDATYGFNNGIDINLKYGNYSNITIEDCDITNSGVNGTATDPQNAAVIAIKARDDSPSYNSNPATLTSVTLTNNRISGPQNGIRFGEFGKINNTPTNVLMEGNDLSFPFANKAIVRRTNADVNLLCNWHGSTSLPVILGTFAEAGTGSTILSSILLTGGDGNPAVGFQPSGTCGCPSGNLVTNTNTPETFCTIQAAIDDPDTDAGDVIVVGPGTYIENIVLNKDLDLRGNNYNINPNTGIRGPESIIVPATSDPDPNSPTAVNIMYLTAAATGSYIDGFIIDGDNPNLTSAVNINGANIDAIECIAGYDGTGNLYISNNILRNVTYAGIDMYNYYNGGGVTSDNYIWNNKIDNIAQSPYGVGIIIYNNFYASIALNVMTRVRVGVQTGNFYSANTGGTNSISNNAIQAERRGIFHNLAYGSASPITIGGNTITTVPGALNHLGISVSSIGGTVGATIANNNIDGAYAGVDFWNCTSSPAITVSGGMITNCNYGVVASNYDGYNSNANSSSVRISGVTVTGSTVAAVHVKDNPLNSNGATINLTVDNDCEINGTSQLLTGILVTGPQASATVQGNDASINGFAIGIDVDGGSATITNNHIYDNGIGVRFTNSGFGTVHTNRFQDALPNGKDIQSTLSGGAVTATPNNWFAGTTFGVENLSSLSIDATSSYWNNASGPGPVGPGTGANITTNVLYCPWLGDIPTAFGGTGLPVSSPTVTIVISETSGLANNDGTICAGASVTLDATTTSAISYLWSNGQTTPSIIVSPAVTTAYSVTVTFAGCTDDDMVTITVDPLPIVSGPSAVCVGSMIQMLPSSGGTWTSSNPLLATIDMNTGVVTGVAAGGPVTFTYTETLTGCSSTTGPVTVNPLPSAVITAPQFVWESTPGYAASVPDAGMGASYTWTASTGSITSGTPAVTFTSGLAPTMMINVTVTDANGCSSTGTFTVNVLPACLSIDFDDPVLLSNTQQLGYWYTDRYNPNGFVGQATAPDATPNTLHVSIDAADGQVSGFYNTQGRKHDLIDGTQSIQADLYIPAAWSSTGRRMAGMWGTGFDVSNVVSAYPIIEFTSDGANPRFRVWESGTGVFVDLGLPPGFAYDNWVTFRTQLLPSGEFLFTVETAQGDLQYTTTTSAPDATVDILNVILQGHNTTAGVTYDIYWDNFKASTTISPVLTAPAIVFENTGGYTASVPDAGMGSTYVWTLSDGTIDSGAGTNSISFTSGDSPSMVISVVVTPANGCPASASATLSVLDECQMIDFSDPLILSNTQATGVWYTDRYNPFGFAAPSVAPDATPNTLKVSINAADGQVSGFYNTQGRKYDLIAGTQAIEADLYVPFSWSSTGRRMAGMWGTAFDAGNNVSGFPILEYTSDGANPRFRVWESGTGVWVDLGLPPGFVYNKWVTLRTQLLASGEFYYTVVTEQGNLQYTTNTSAPDASVDIVNVILQGHNTTAGVTYDIYWDNFKSTTILTPVLEINNAPIANNGISTHCIGDMVTVEVTGGAGTYEIEYDGNIVHTGNVGDAGYNFTAIINLAGVYTVTVEDPDGCVSVSNFTLVVNVCADPSAFQWVPDNSAHGSCPGTTNCCTDIICYGLEYTPGVTGNLTSYTTGFFANCLGGMTPIASNLSCVMTDNSFEINQCMAIDSILFNSSGNGGSVPVMAGTPIILHKVCFNLSAGESIEIREDNVTNLSTSVDLTGGGLYTEFPSFMTPTVLTKPLPVIPALGVQTVSCPAQAVLPTPPSVLDYCGNPVPATLLTTVDVPPPVVCEGTRTYNFNYTDCAGNTYPWSFTYTIDYSGGLTAPMSTMSTVSCPAEATDPGAPAPIMDACGRVVNAVFVSSTTPPACEGSVVWTYRYTACDMTTTADWTHTYTIDYSGGLTAPANTVATVSCPADATDPGAPANIMDACGRTVVAVFVATEQAPDPVTCNGTIVWRYRYTACDGTTTADWTKTYTVTYSGGLTAPANTVATVSCPADATDPGAPANIMDACGRTVTAVFVATEQTPDPVTCNGTIVWRYRYTACDGTTTADWTKTYTVTYSGGLTTPANTVATVSCPADATDPGAPANIMDACGRTVVAVFVATEQTPDPVTCNGTIVWRYRYTACDGTTTADWTKTYTVTYSGGLTAPANTVATVSCPADATDPGAPANIMDACGRTVVAVFVATEQTPDPVTCNGTIVWRYRYTACDGTTTADWTKTYTVTYSGGLTAPANTVATVSCPADATDPGAPANIMDACGRTVVAVFVATEQTPDPVTCNGTIVWRYRYTACDGTTTADWTKTYTVTYSGGLTAPANTVATVSCPADATDPGAPANIMDACGRTVVAVFVATEQTPDPVTCNGTIVWRYRYTACDGTTTADWTKTYTVTYSGGLIPPVSTMSTVACPANATDPGAPAPIMDACGRVVNAVFVSSTTPPACEGSVVWTYRYTACDMITTADWTHTYTIERLPFNNPVDQGSTVFCPFDTDTPPTPPVVLDNCGNTLTPSAPIISPIPGCDGTRTYTYTFTDCEGNTQDWVYTYTVDCDPLTLKVLLEGPYIPGTGTMNNDLHDDHLLPGQDKLLSPDLAIQLGAPWTPFGQPYNTAPWNYNGNTGLNFGDPSSPGAPMGVIPYDLDVVDWVLVTVRKNGQLPAHNHWTCAGWVHQDGEVTFPESCGTLSLNGADNYYVMVQHRNHLGILSPAPVLEPCSGYVIDWDFTASNSYQPTFRYGQKMVDTGIWAMHAANGDQLTSISAISSPDRTTWRLLQGVLGYSVGDYNMSSVVTPPDETVWKTNQNKTSGVIFY